MSRGKKLFVLFAVFMVIIGIYYYIANKPAEMNEKTQPVEINQSITLHDFENSDIERLLLKKKDENILLINGETPTVDGLSDVKLDTSKLNTIFYNFSSLKADKLVEENAKDIEKYGLEKPFGTITGIIKDKDPIILHIGNKTIDGRYYFVRLNEANTVYLIKSYVGQHFMTTPADLRDATLPNIDPQFTQYLYLETSGNKPIEVIYNADVDTQKAAYGIGLFSLTQPYSSPKGINYLKFEEIMKGIPNFTAEKFIDDHPEGLSAYGLDNPPLRLRLKSNNQETNTSKEVDLLFGDTFDQNYVYFKYADRDNVYGIRNDFMELLLNVTPFDMMDKFIYTVNIKEIKELEVSDRNSTYTFEIKNTTIKEDDQKEKVEQVFSYEDKKLDDGNFRQLYQLIIGISADSEVNHVNDAVGNKEFTITYTFNDDTKKTITYMSYNDLFYSHQIENNIYFLSASKQINAIVDKIEEIINE